MANAEALDVAKLIRDRSASVVEAWQRAIGNDVSLDREQVAEPLPRVIGGLARWFEGDREAALDEVSEHVLQRFKHGQPIDALVREYLALRRCLYDVLGQVVATPLLEPALEIVMAHATRHHVALDEELRERFIGILAHDLRTPLTCVTLASEMLMDDDATAQHKQLLRHVIDASDRMQRMVQDVLSWTRENLGNGFPTTLRSENFGAILVQVVDEARIVHPDAQITYETQGDLHGQFDRDRVHQALTNLVRNAIEHGTGAACLEAIEIDRGQTIVLNVKNPVSRSSASSSDASDPFRRRRRPTTARGFGLYIVDQIARGHGATLEMSSTQATTTITIQWPTRRPATSL